MNLNHLGSFDAVACEGSVSKGADRLKVSQPAISKQLKDFERSLGTVLFERMPRGVRLTEAGKILAGYARRVIATVEEAERAIAELRGLHRGRLSVAASTTIGVYLLPEVLMRFGQKYPGVQVHLEIAHSDAIQHRLLNGDIDVGLTEGAVPDDGVESTVFMEDQLVAIAPRKHALSRKRSVSIQMLCREPFVVRETGSATKSLVERSLVERGLGVKPAMSLGSTEAIKRAVIAGVGIAIVSRLAIELELKAGRLAVVPVRDFSIRRPLQRLTTRGGSMNPSVKAFNQMLDEAVLKT